MSKQRNEIQFYCTVQAVLQQTQTLKPQTSNLLTVGISA